MKLSSIPKRTVLLLGLAAAVPPAWAAEHITLRNGFEIDCARRTVEGSRVRLYLTAGSAQDAGFVEIAADSILRVEEVAPPQTPVDRAAAAPPSTSPGTASDMNAMLVQAGALHRIDADMLASIVLAESGGDARAVSRAGAKGLMQLMPGTAANLGVADVFEPRQNIAGGTAYLDLLLTRYHDDIALALAAYNAGPGAVDRYHGIPPYRETRLYVARVLREFNRRKQARLVADVR